MCVYIYIEYIYIKSRPPSSLFYITPQLDCYKLKRIIIRQRQFPCLWAQPNPQRHKILMTLLMERAKPTNPLSQSH